MNVFVTRGELKSFRPVVLHIEASSQDELEAFWHFFRPAAPRLFARMEDLPSSQQHAAEKMRMEAFESLSSTRDKGFPG